MHPLAARLLDAHVQHTLQELQVERLQAHLAEEIALGLQHLQEQKLKTLHAREPIKRGLQDLLLDRPSAPLINTLALALGRELLAHPLQKQTCPGDLINADEAERLIDRLLDLEDLRRDLVKAVLASPVYSDLLSDLLYNGIRDYLLEDNILTKKVPGMSSLMKLGKGMVNRVGGLEEGIERTIKQTIAKNLRSSLELSEQLLEKAFRGARLRQALIEAWQKVSRTPLEQVTRYVGERELVDAQSIALTLWEHARQTPYAHTLLDAIVDSIARQLDEMSVQQLVEGLAIDLPKLAQELLAVVEPLLRQLHQSGHLEARVRAHLHDFYASAAATALFD